jgi:hypothetical protein
LVTQPVIGALEVRRGAEQRVLGRGWRRAVGRVALEKRRAALCKLFNNRCLKRHTAAQDRRRAKKKEEKTIYVVV